MSKPLLLLSIGLLLGMGGGFLLASATYQAPPSSDASAHDHSAHDHGNSTEHTRLTDVSGPVPTLILTLHPDGRQSRNLHIGVTNFTFAPGAVNGPHVPGQGHAHIYVNNIKIARAYGAWMQLAALPKGTHTIRVTLNANDHTALAIGGAPIEATTTVTIE